MIELKNLSRKETIRYLGGAKVTLNKKIEAMMDICEKQILSSAKPKYLYKIVSLPFENIITGNDIKNLLADCDKAIIMCATIGNDIDKLIRTAQISDMAKAVVLDSMASVAVEQLCNKVDETLAQTYPNLYMTYRFSPGYGDYPIEMQKIILNLLDAQRKIGLTTNDNFLLIPSKSVTAVAGLSKTPIKQKNRGCACCNMRACCKYKESGEHCGF